MAAVNRRRTSAFSASSAAACPSAASTVARFFPQKSNSYRKLSGLTIPNRILSPATFGFRTANTPCCEMRSWVSEASASRNGSSRAPSTFTSASASRSRADARLRPGLSLRAVSISSFNSGLLNCVHQRSSGHCCSRLATSARVSCISGGSSSSAGGFPGGIQAQLPKSSAQAMPRLIRSRGAVLQRDVMAPPRSILPRGVPATLPPESSRAVCGSDAQTRPVRRCRGTGRWPRGRHRSSSGSPPLV